MLISEFIAAGVATLLVTVDPTGSFQGVGIKR